MAMAVVVKPYEPNPEAGDGRNKVVQNYFNSQCKAVLVLFPV